MDCRNIGKIRGNHYGTINKNTMQMTVIMTDDDDNETEVSFPIRFEVCNTCEGRGRHVDPNIDSNGITSDEWNEWDDDEREGYMSGRYDITCLECHGDKVTPEIDNSKMDDKQKELYKKYLDKLNDDIAYAHECMMERRMESGDW